MNFGWFVAAKAGARWGRTVAGVVIGLIGVPVLLTVLVLASSRQASTAPLSGDAVRPMRSWVVTQEFGCTGFEYEPRRGDCAHFHEGIDLAAPEGVEVFAVRPGVAEVRMTGGYGIHVVIRHDDTLLTLYGHLASVTVSSGDPVQAGQVIGAEGSTGASTGPHLHFEVRVAGNPVNPRDALPEVFDRNQQPGSAPADASADPPTRRGTE